MIPTEAYRLREKVDSGWHEIQASITCQNRPPGATKCLIVSIDSEGIRIQVVSDGPLRGPKPPAKPPGDGRIETRADKAERKALEGRTPNMPGFHEVMRCARCGNVRDRSSTQSSPLQAMRCRSSLRVRSASRSIRASDSSARRPIAARDFP